MNNKTILIADDDQDFLRLEALFLTRAGYGVLFARDAYQALRSALTQHPDLLLLDVNMPAGDGLSVQQRIRNAPALRDIPVIYVTGQNSESIQRAAREMGAFAVLHKPFEYETLLATIRQALAPPSKNVTMGDSVLVLKTG